MTLWLDACSPWLLDLILQVFDTTSLQLYVYWQVLLLWYSVRDKGRKLPGLIEEQRELILDSPAFRQKGKNVSLINKQNKLVSRQAGYTKVFPFCGPGYIFPTVSLFLSFLWKRGIAII
jgi:hypothetical protein